MLASAALSAATRKPASDEPLTVAGRALPDLCPIHCATGRNCPGCGMGRAFVLLWRGRLRQAVGSNPASPFLFAALIWLAVAPLRPPERRQSPSSPIQSQPVRSKRPMTFGEAISDGFSKYATFSGRSSRSAYWWWTLFYVLIIIGASIVDAAIKTPIIAGLAWLAFIIPNLAVLVRRLHDTDRSGWWVLIGFIPLIGAIVLIVFACTDSGGPNKHGDGPDGKGNLSVTSPLGQTLPPPPPPAPQGPPPEMPPPSESERAPS